VVAAIARKTRMHEISTHDAMTAISTFKSHFTTQYEIVLMTTVLVERAMELAEKHRLRGYDATQLASALVVQAELAANGAGGLVFISADADLNDVAQAEHLSVQNPNDHP